MQYKSEVSTTVTRNIPDFDNKTGNLYETLVVISKRANQIASEMKEELNAKLSEFNTSTDNLEEVFENREQIEISKFYERMPKSTSVAIDEFMEGKVRFHLPEENE